MDLRNHPQFAIIGAPKAGTSSVHSWLSQFVAINASSPKETFFFIDNDCPMKNARFNCHKDGLEAYSNFFTHLDSHRFTLDSTTHHMYQSTALDHFSRAKTKVLAILRDPVKRVVSYYQYLCFTKSAVRQPLEFAEYIDCVLTGNAARLRPMFYEENRYYALAMAVQHGQYIDYLEKWKQRIGTDRLKIVLFENLVANRRQTLCEIGDFFDVSPTEKQLAELPRENQTVAVKSAAINRFARNFASWIPAEKLRMRLRNIYFWLQKKEIPDTASLYPDEISKLTEHFRCYNRRLAESFSLDLSPWPSFRDNGAIPIARSN